MSDIMPIPLSDLFNQIEIKDNDMKDFYFSYLPNAKIDKVLQDFTTPSDPIFLFKRDYLLELKGDDLMDYLELGEDFWEDYIYEEASKIDWSLLNIDNDDKKDIYLRCVKRHHTVTKIKENTFFISIVSSFRLSGNGFLNALKDINLTQFISYNESKKTVPMMITNKDSFYFLNSTINQVLLIDWLRFKITEMVFKVKKNNFVLKNGFMLTAKNHYTFLDCFEFPDFCINAEQSVFSIAFQREHKTQENFMI
jgi:hypothetical protein